ncbi:MAG: hypothetical protein I3J02_01455 [Prevotella sp.]|nr:hypothetical protein [Prevotella sp.]
MNTTSDFETLFRDNLVAYLQGLKEVDDHLPEAPDIESLWGKIGESYLPDGMREFNQYPTVAFGWMMYVGMAIAKYWDEDWELYSKVDDLYVYLRDKIDFDHLDDYVREKVLLLKPDEADRLQDIVSESASRIYSQLRHLPVEPGTEKAFRAFVAAIHQMYLMGAAMQLKRMGYHMTRLGS